ncbi:MAG TPA: sigma-54 dependent transcriptional regulator [Terriglobales bacterium]|nr:sigma-54 dependent transcriptional regulator [Terriglobales bacterium]
MVLASESQEAFRVLVVDDEENVVAVMPEIFADMPVKVLVAQDEEAGWSLFRQHRPRLVFLDLKLRGTNGMNLLARIAGFDQGAEVILLSGEYSPAIAIEAIQKGAAEFLVKPVDVSGLRARVARALEDAAKKRRTGELETQLRASFSFYGMIGRSPRMLDVFNKLARIAPHFTRVLLTGPSGTGKELVARALHNLSPVSRGPFVACNCAALPESLAESQFFGFRKGAFTGAFQDTPGLFESADHGTIFLDEISEMSIAMQAKLLRVLQSDEVQRLGSVESRKLHLRAIAASNRDLTTEVAEGRFREDLFYRLSAVRLHLPPLSERKEDLPLLERHFLEKYAKQYGRIFTGISRRAQDMLARHDWPGNIRELENVIAGACILSEGPVLDLDDFPAALSMSPEKTVDTKFVSLQELERKYAREVLEAFAGNKQKAAEILGISRSTLYNILSDLPAVTNE